MPSNLLSLAVCVGVPLVGGQIGGMLSAPDILGKKSWYNRLRKPKWCPPKFLFGPIWSVLYTAAGVASWIVWKQPGVARALPLSLYGVNMLLNVAWTPIFFKTHRTDWALADSAAMLGMAVAATVSMSQAVGAKKVLPLMGPYCAFVTFATALTYNIHKNNRKDATLKTEPSA